MESDSKTELETKIHGVIIYQTGVQITQVGSINLESGEQILIITNLSESLDKESIRVKGVGNGKIMNISVEFNSKKEYKTEEHKVLLEEREKIEKEIKKTEKELERAHDQLGKYKSTEDTFYSLWAKAFAFGEVDLTKFSNFNEKIDEFILSRTDDIQSLEDKLKELRTELQVVFNKISKLGPIEKVQNYYEIMINLNVMQAGEFKIELKYTMGDAWWVPFYDVALSEDKAQLTMFANVFNRTGEDWENVNIEISTASLKPISLIKPTPTILQEYVSQYYGYGGGKSRGRKLTRAPAPMKIATETSASYDKRDTTGEFMEKEVDLLAAAPPPLEPEIQESYAEVSENIGVQSFKIPNRIDIPSDKNPHPVNLTIIDLETEKKYYWSVSNPSSAVVIQDTMVNGDLLILAGNVKIYYQEEFLGETSIPVIAPKEKFKLGTRISYDLKIEKKLIDRSKDKKAVKGRLKNNYEYKINIKNLNKASEQLTIYDRIPHSSSENIKVEVEEINPELDKKELGVLKWNIDLKNIEEKVIQYKYFVDYKKGIIITPSLP